jgi:hypothetical protein
MAIHMVLADTRINQVNKRGAQLGASFIYSA